ncbi:Response regulator mcs4 isoform A, partial [Neolecta irregularis DAH-3]
QQQQQQQQQASPVRSPSSHTSTTLTATAARRRSSSRLEQSQPQPADPPASQQHAASSLSIKNLLEGMVPPIKVLIVEDNPINQQILIVFMKKRDIHYEVASNGQEAVDKWANGTFHLILMDIQLPVKSGIDATKEIRDTERARTSKSFPVIIVALTASSFNSDRHEALAAGCNDYLTKPVSLVWLERKISEWGCMQALIDHQGWARWKRKE